jgi:small subunit ribosomal protein S6
MRDYEIVYIFKSGFTPDEIERKLEQYHGVLTGTGAEVTAVEQWGKRQLAYPIRKETSGYYVVARFSSDPDPLPEFERILTLDEELLRYLIVLSEGELPTPPTMMGDTAGPVAEPGEDEDEDKDEDDEDDEDDDEDKDEDDEADDEDKDEDDEADDEDEDKDDEEDEAEEDDEEED